VIPSSGSSEGKIFFPPYGAEIGRLIKILASSERLFRNNGYATCSGRSLKLSATFKHGCILAMENHRQPNAIHGDTSITEA
jgi:hypothetical protein